MNKLSLKGAASLTVLTFVLSGPAWALRPEGADNLNMRTGLEQTLRVVADDELRLMLDSDARDPRELARELIARVGWLGSVSEYARYGLEAHIEMYRNRPSDIEFRQERMKKVQATLNHPPEDISVVESALLRLTLRKFGNIQVEGKKGVPSIYSPALDLEIVKKMIGARRPVWLFGGLVTGFPGADSDVDIEFQLKEEGVLGILEIPLKSDESPRLQSIPNYEFVFFMNLMTKRWSGLQIMEPFSGENALLISADRLFSLSEDGESWRLNGGILAEIFRANQQIRGEIREKQTEQRFTHEQIAREALQLQAAALNSDSRPILREGTPVVLQDIDDLLVEIRAISEPKTLDELGKQLWEERIGLVDRLNKDRQNLSSILESTKDDVRTQASALAMVANRIACGWAWLRHWKRYGEQGNTVLTSGGLEEMPDLKWDIPEVIPENVVDDLQSFLVCRRSV